MGDDWNNCAIFHEVGLVNWIDIGSCLEGLGVGWSPQVEHRFWAIGLRSKAGEAEVVSKSTFVQGTHETNVMVSYPYCKKRLNTAP